MSADLGTRKGAKIEDVSNDGSWQNGQDWAKLNMKDLPIKAVNEINLKKEDHQLYNDECLVLDDKWINKQLTLEYSLTKQRGTRQHCCSVVVLAAKPLWRYRTLSAWSITLAVSNACFMELRAATQNRLKDAFFPLILGLAHEPIGVQFRLPPRPFDMTPKCGNSIDPECMP